MKNASVFGVNGTLPTLGIETVRWKVNNDTGRQNVFEIPRTMYVPKLKNCILSP